MFGAVRRVSSGALVQAGHNVPEWCLGRRWDPRRSRGLGCGPRRPQAPGSIKQTRADTCAVVLLIPAAEVPCES